MPRSEQTIEFACSSRRLPPRCHYPAPGAHTVVLGSVGSAGHVACSGGAVGRPMVTTRVLCRENGRAIGGCGGTRTFGSPRSTWVPDPPSRPRWSAPSQTLPTAQRVGRGGRAGPAQPSAFLIGRITRSAFPWGTPSVQRAMLGEQWAEGGAVRALCSNVGDSPMVEDSSAWESRILSAETAPGGRSVELSIHFEPEWTRAGRIWRLERGISGALSRPWSSCGVRSNLHYTPFRRDPMQRYSNPSARGKFLAQAYNCDPGHRVECGVPDGLFVGDL